MVIGKLVVLCFVLFVPLHNTAADSPARLFVKSSPDAAFESELAFDSAELNRAIAKGEVRKTAVYPAADTYLIANKKTYILDPSFDLYDVRRSETIRLTAEMKRKLQEYAKGLRSFHYGQLMSWEDAKKIISMKSFFSVVDLESGLQFQVQRRAGKTHADVQPLTKRDTKIMKQIYQGKWSWKRRAVLVKKDGRAIAASMHGMPHGGDGIPGNGFRGHFCIHFLGSSTHGSGNIDPDHQIMVHKAAGQLSQYVQQLAPHEIVELFFTAINQRDPEIMAAIFPHRKHEQFQSIVQEAENIIAIRSNDGIPKANDDIMAAEMAVNTVIFRSGSVKEEKNLDFQLSRGSLLQPWKIESISFK